MQFRKYLLRTFEPSQSALYHNRLDPQPFPSHTEVSERIILQTLQQQLNTTSTCSRAFRVIQIWYPPGKIDVKNRTLFRTLKAQMVLKNEQNVGFRCGLREKHSLAD
ncbi:hypothetical protein TNCV_1353621 [Trichonephila clavipes]|nr:hypothetical protein TNCV_1353621 [Trichonephila clavipes]